MDGDAELLTTTETGGSGGDGGGGSETISLEETAGAEEITETTGKVEGAEETTSHEETVAPKEEPELSEFKGLVSARVRGLIKQAPELSQVFQKYPKIQEQVEAVFRREAAMRDVFPTVAEARQMREIFPNGIADVQELQNDSRELDELDVSFDSRDAEGKYPGHVQIINNFFDRDREAAVALFRQIPKEWYRLDPESYNDVMGQIVGSTFIRRGIPEFLDGIIAEIDEEQTPALKKSLTNFANWVKTYTSEKPKPTEEQQRLDADKNAFNKEKATRLKEEGDRFHRVFVSEAKKLQLNAINTHPAIKRLMTVQSITQEKKNDIIEQVRKNVEQFLAKSPSFMRKLRPAYNARNMAEVEKIQRAAWAMPWLLNRAVRTVLQKEVPQMVSNTREAAARRAGTSQRQAAPGKTGDQRPKTPTGPYQENGRWYKKDGTPFTVAEVVAGKHLAA